MPKTISSSQHAAHLALFLSFIFAAADSSHASNVQDSATPASAQVADTTISIEEGVLKIVGRLEREDARAYYLTGDGSVNDYLIFDGTALLLKSGGVFEGSGTLTFQVPNTAISYLLYEGHWSFTPSTGVSDTLSSLGARLKVSGLHVEPKLLAIKGKTVTVTGSITYKTGKLDVDRLMFASTGVTFDDATLKVAGVTIAATGGIFNSTHVKLATCQVRAASDKLVVTAHDLIISSTEVTEATAVGLIKSVTVTLDQGHFTHAGFSVGRGSLMTHQGIGVAFANLVAATDVVSMASGTFTAGALVMTASGFVVTATDINIQRAGGLVPDVGDLTLAGLGIGDHFTLSGGAFKNPAVEASFFNGNILPHGISIGEASIKDVTAGVSISVNGLLATSEGVDLASGQLMAGPVEVSLATGYFHAGGVFIGSAHTHTPDGIDLNIHNVAIDGGGVSMASGAFASGGLLISATDLEAHAGGISIAYASGTVTGVGSLSLEELAIGDTFQLTGGSLDTGDIHARFSGGRVLPHGISVNTAEINGLPADTAVSVHSLMATSSDVTLQSGMATVSGFSVSLSAGEFNASGVDIGAGTMTVSDFNLALNELHVHSGGLNMEEGRVHVGGFGLDLRDFTFDANTLHISDASAELASVNNFRLINLTLTSDGHFALGGGSFKAGDLGAGFFDGQILTNGIHLGEAMISGLPNDVSAHVQDLTATSSGVTLAAGFVSVSEFRIDLEEGAFNSQGIDIGKGDLAAGSYHVDVTGLHIRSDSVNLLAGSILAGGLDIELEGLAINNDKLEIDKGSAEVDNTDGFFLENLILTSSGHFSLTGGGFTAGGAGVGFTGGVFQSDNIHVNTAFVMGGEGLNINVQNLTVRPSGVKLGKGHFEVYGVTINLDSADFNEQGFYVAEADATLSDISVNIEGFAVSDHGILLTGGGFQFAGLAAQFNAGEEDSANGRLSIDAFLSLPENLGGASASTHFYLQDGKIIFESGRIDIKGPIGVPGSGLGFQNLFFEFDIPNSLYAGGGEVSIPAFLTIGAALRIYDGHLDYLYVSVSDFSPPIDVSGGSLLAFLDSIEMHADNLAHRPLTRRLSDGSTQIYYEPISFGGGFGIYAGPPVHPRVVAASIDATIYETGVFQATGHFDVLGFKDLASGWFRLSPKGQKDAGFKSEFRAGFKYACCSGLSVDLGGNANLRIPQNLDVTGSADAWVHIRAWIVKFDGGADVYFNKNEIGGNFTIKSCVSCSHIWCGGHWSKCVSTHYHFKVRQGDISVGAPKDAALVEAMQAADAWAAGQRPIIFKNKSGFDYGSIQMATNWELVDAGGWGRAKSLKPSGAASESFDFFIEAATPGDQFMFVCNYQKDTGPAALQLHTPFGEVFDATSTPAFDLNGVGSSSPVTYDSDASMGTAVFHLIIGASNTQDGLYRLIIENPAEIGAHEVELLKPNEPPVIEILSIEESGDPDNSRYTINWAASDPDNPGEARITLYVTGDHGDYTGLAISPVEDATGTAMLRITGATGTFEIDERQTEIPGGDYFVLARIDDQYNSPRFAYSDRKIRIDNIHAPEQVMNLEARGGDNFIALHWGAVEGETSYRVYWTDDLDEDDYKWSTDIGNQTNFVIDEFIPGRTYRITVSAINAFGEGPHAVPEAIMPLVPLAPAGLGSLIVSASNPYNNPPYISSDPPVHVKLGDVYRYAVRVDDFEGGELVYSLPLAPTGMTVSATGLVEWTPSRADLGGATVTVRVTDFHGAADEQNYIVIISPQRVDSLPPRIVSHPGQTAHPEEVYAYQLEVVNAAPEEVRYILAEGPAGMVLSSTGLLTWTPGAESIGEHWCTLIAQAPNGDTDDQAFVITVLDTYGGDFDRDGQIDPGDVYEMALRWNSDNDSPAYDGRFDLYLDGRIDEKDVVRYVDLYHKPVE